ncbi:hypothetical protein LTR10_018228 [Elasticomyces elasticus]|uniref:Uncharacterized protein n=1 Tax=Exophiala sideris TaxID=1016849 RepID=A0ABR0JJI6_9EURO|nr:hypothetical protein LTR10_018228 [Elasticomyces elasticus]KAK5034531.1 hypothetical protein LTS07_003452 [Exophiala sideris]KAK5042827.1 hypothetical protein LTR13_001675 [Exophiala sideris]KAK5065910.1 hypothetical protein LTR69_003460 [Exophiala sideris]KAK5185629.1 hypothetical protein LTR44_001678 [Eurotiomycetes sp. CCFEE 6388]
MGNLYWGEKQALKQSAWRQRLMLRKSSGASCFITLIEPFTLLDTAKGGLSIKFIAQEAEVAAVSALNIKVLQQLKWYTNDSSSLEAIHDYATAIQTYANSHPETTNTAKYPITDAVGKYTIMFTIGSDMTVEMMTGLKPWYKGGFEFADLLIFIFNTPTGLELGYGTTSSSFVRDMFEKHQLSIVDLYPWPSKKTEDLVQALKFLRDYLQKSIGT